MSEEKHEVTEAPSWWLMDITHCPVCNCTVAMECRLVNSDVFKVPITVSPDDDLRNSIVDWARGEGLVTTTRCCACAEFPGGYCIYARGG